MITKLIEMIKTKKGLRQKNKLTGLADTEPSVSADFSSFMRNLVGGGIANYFL